MKKILTSIISIAVLAAMLVTAAGAAGFSDTTGHWAADYINEAVTLGYFTGNDDGTFAPDGSTTRGMFITILGRAAKALGIYDNAADIDISAPEFIDVSADAYYAEYVAWAVKNGITNGIDDKTFGPDVNVTREQMCTFIIRFIENCLGNDLSEYSSDISSFADSDSISDYAKKYVGLCVSLGLINGIEENGVTRFSPADNATRAQVSVVFVKINTVTTDWPVPGEDETDNGASGNGSSGNGTSGGDPTDVPSDETHTDEELAEETEVVGYLETISSNSKTSSFLKNSSEAVQDCISLLVSCIDDALDEHYNGQFLSKEYIKSQYAAEISELKAAYNALSEEDHDRLANAVIRLETEEHINIVMDYFGVSL